MVVIVVVVVVVGGWVGGRGVSSYKYKVLKMHVAAIVVLQVGQNMDIA